MRRTHRKAANPPASQFSDRLSRVSDAALKAAAWPRPQPGEPRAAPYRLDLDNLLALSCHFVTAAAFAACLLFKLAVAQHVEAVVSHVSRLPWI